MIDRSPGGGKEEKAKNNGPQDDACKKDGEGKAVRGVIFIGEDTAQRNRQQNRRQQGDAEKTESAADVNNKPVFLCEFPNVFLCSSLLFNIENVTQCDHKNAEGFHQGGRQEIEHQDAGATTGHRKHEGLPPGKSITKSKGYGQKEFYTSHQNDLDGF